MYKLYQEYLTALENRGKYRKLPVIDYSKKEDYIDFSSNDYLNLSKDQRLITAACGAAQQYGVGATGSRLLSGNNCIIEKLEATIAIDKRQEDALVFSSGFQANFTVLSSLLDQRILKIKPIVFFDRLNHASLYQAVLFAKPELVRYQHNNMEQLASLLLKYVQDNRPKFIVTETIFGMDGDILPISKIIELAKEHQAFLYLDEAHATGVVGPNGYGLSTTIDLNGIDCLIMGTFSKALGCMGGYIACSKLVKKFLINKAAGFIYSTAPSPMLIGAVNKAWEIVRNLDKERKELHRLAQGLRTKLINLGFNIGNSTTHIIPIIFDNPQMTFDIQQMLLQNLIIASYIRPPTVPAGSTRLRIALKTSHTQQDILDLINQLRLYKSNL